MTTHADIKALEAEYLRLQGIAATEQQRFGFSARPNWLALAKAGADMNRARDAWMSALSNIGDDTDDPRLTHRMA